MQDNEPIKSLRYSKLLDFYEACLTEKQAEAAKNFYNDDLSLGEIAENSGTTRQAVRDNIKRAGLIMEDLETKLHCAAKAEEYYALYDELANRLSVIYNELKHGCNILALRAQAKQALELLEAKQDLL
jgi:predicted DNA-binding protein YlxM (UPF0122 family)